MKTKNIFLILTILCVSILFAQLVAATSIDLNTNESNVKTKSTKLLNYTNKITWNVWLKQDNYISHAGVMGKYENGVGNRSFLIRPVLTDSISVVLSPDGKTGITHTSTTNRKCGIRNDNEWTMITIVYDGKNVVYYRNGVKCDSDPTTVKRLYDANTPINMGGANKVSFDGEIDDYKIYKSALTASQVKRLFDESEHGKNLGKSVAVLVYDQIVENNATAEDKVLVQNFKEQMDYLNKSGFTPIVMSQYDAWKKGQFTMPKKPVLITFDDGWSSVYQNAYPIMKQYGFTGSQFVIIDYANQVSGHTYSNWEELNELKDEGWDLQAHGVQHVNMLTLDESEFRRQLKQTQDNITEKTGTKPEAFVFPFHSANETYANICGEYYDLCWTRSSDATNPAYVYKSTDPDSYNTLRRITIAYNTLISTFKSLLGRDTDIKGEWQMNEGSGTVTKDTSGSKLDATIVKGTWKTDSGSNSTIVPGIL